MATKTETYNLSQSLQQCVKHSDITHLKNLVEPNIQAFRKKIDQFTLEHHGMKLCISQFDNDICIKANKQSLIELETSLYEKFISQKSLADLMSKITTIINKSETEMEKVRKEFDDQARNSNERIMTLCSKHVNDKLQQYESVSRSFR